MRIYLDDTSKLGANFLYVISRSDYKRKFSFVINDNHKITEEDIKNQFFYIDLDYRSFGTYVIKNRLKNLIDIEEIITLTPRLSLEEIISKYKIDLIVDFNQDPDIKEFVFDKAFLYNIPIISFFNNNKPKVIFIKNFKESIYNKIEKILQDFNPKKEISIETLLFVIYKTIKILRRISREVYYD